MFSWPMLGSLIPIDTSLYATAHLNMLAEDLASQLLLKCTYDTNDRHALHAL
uniref:Uncharacterized protein n=1 Tax=Oncorhynchus tshawytscha TaxID=74940 RepID=A0AAZ3NT31_ONCTS